MAIPLLRYGASSLSLSGNLSPTFPASVGAQLFSAPLDNPKYIETSRYAGCSAMSWNVQNVKKSDRDTLWTWYNTTINSGEYDFTVIDQRNRCLFDASWNDWQERWVGRGHQHTVSMDLQSPFPWLPPAHGLYLMADGTLDDHLLTGVDCATVDGSLVNNTTDNAVLRLSDTGAALRLQDNAGAAKTGASGSISYQRQKPNNSISMFCQCKTPEIKSSIYPIVLTAATGDEIRLFISTNGANKNLAGFRVTTGASYDQHNSTVAIDPGTWVDLCYTFDDENNLSRLYWWLSNTGTQWAHDDDFLYNSTVIADYVVAGTPSTACPIDNTYTTIEMLKMPSAEVMQSPDYAYLQNIMLFDDYLTPGGFNFLRRLCHMWNNKLLGTWPK